MTYEEAGYILEPNIQLKKDNITEYWVFYLDKNRQIQMLLDSHKDAIDKLSLARQKIAEGWKISDFILEWF